MKKVSIMGMGALGLMYGTLIKKNAPEVELTYVADKNRAVKYNDTDFEVNGEAHRFCVTAKEKAEEADLLIVAVKYTGFSDALEYMKNCIGSHTIIISVMNGISSERLIGERYGFEHIVYSVAQGMDAMKFDNKLTYTQSGELRIGVTKSGKQENLVKLTKFFDRIQLSYTLEDDILYRLWGKLMLNVGINQTCMVYGQTYGQVLEKGESNRTFYAACREVLAVAIAEGINLTEEDIKEYVNILGTLSYDGMPSMAQDRVNKKSSEVDMFAGTVIELGKKHDISVPTNDFLYERIKETEKEYIVR